MKYRDPPDDSHLPFPRAHAPYREYEPAGPPWRRDFAAETDHAAFVPREVPAMRGWWRRRGYAERCPAAELHWQIPLIRPRKRPRPPLGPCEATMRYLIDLRAELVARRRPQGRGRVGNPERARGEHELDFFLVAAMADWIYALAEDYARRAGRRPFRRGRWLWPKPPPFRGRSG